MADLVIDPERVALVKAFEKLTLPADEAIEAGEMVRIDPTTGRFTLANATSAAEGRAFGMAVRSVAAGAALTAVKRGIMDIGDALDDNDHDDEIQLSDTAGALDDGAGSPTGAYPVGRVFPGFGSVTVDKLLFIDIAL